MKIYFLNYLLIFSLCSFLIFNLCLAKEILGKRRLITEEIESFVNSYQEALRENDYEKLLSFFNDDNPEFKKQETEKWKALFGMVDISTLKVEYFIIGNNEKEAEIILSHKTKVPLFNLIISHYINEVYKIRKIKEKWYLSNYTVFKDLYDITHYNLKVNLLPELSKLKVSAVVLLKKEPRNKGKYFLKLDEDFQIDKVTCKGLDVEFKKTGYILFLREKNRSVDKNIEFTIDYSGKVIEKNNQYVKEEFSIIRWENFWYPKRDTEDYATGIVEITVPKGIQTICDTGTISKTIRGNETDTFIWDVKEPTNSFGFLASNNWEINQVEINNQKISLYLLKNTKLNIQKMVEKANEILNFYNETFGPTKKRKFAFVEAPFSFTRPNYIPFDENIMAHEIAHNWWLGGFSAECEKNLWLCEGFAEYSGIFFTEAKYGKKALKEELFHELISYINIIISEGDQPLIKALYSQLVYKKGAYVLHNLRYIIGDKVFLKTLQHYVKKYFNQDVNYKSFQSAVEEIYGQKLDWFFEQWLMRKGLPEFELKYEIEHHGNNKCQIEGEIIQKQNPFTMPIDIRFVSDKKSITERIWITDKEKSKKFTLNLDFVPYEIILDPEMGIPRYTLFNKSLAEGIKLFEEKKCTDAVEKLMIALNLKPNNVLAKRILMEVYFEMEDYINFEKEANYLINREYKEYEHDPRRWAYLLYGKFYDLNNERKKAIEMYKKVLEIERGDEYPLRAAKKYLESSYKQH